MPTLDAAPTRPIFQSELDTLSCLRRTARRVPPRNAPLRRDPRGARPTGRVRACPFLAAGRPAALRTRPGGGGQGGPGVAAASCSGLCLLCRRRPCAALGLPAAPDWPVGITWPPSAGRAGGAGAPRGGCCCWSTPLLLGHPKAAETPHGRGGGGCWGTPWLLRGQVLPAQGSPVRPHRRTGVRRSCLPATPLDDLREWEAEILQKSVKILTPTGPPARISRGTWQAV